jgi:hypothetical protein
MPNVLTKTKTYVLRPVQSIVLPAEAYLVASDIVYLDEAHQIAKAQKTAVRGYHHYRALYLPIL